MKKLPIRVLQRTLCPYSRRLRAYVSEKQLELEFVTFDPDEHQDELARMNPHHEVPTALLPDGSPLYDSLLIMEYLEDAHPEPRLMPKDAVARARTRMLYDVAGMLGPALPGFVRAPKDHPERLRRAAELAAETCHALPLLDDVSDYALGAEFGFADLSLPPLLLRALEAGLPADSLPTRVRRWVTAAAGRPSLGELFPEALAALS
ncbi:MAG: glutathione S-transferase family protein [Deltaproteobacteria bacterium]|nr:glutathione S-transferase family protein [Deltaproteobacteria bacterium]